MLSTSPHAKLALRSSSVADPHELPRASQFSSPRRHYTPSPPNHAKLPHVTLTYQKAEPVSLKKSVDVDEAWLQEKLAEDPTILGLGELDVVTRERKQPSGGRLDILLSDSNETRYEVELMLGATDPSHIIRTIEYWDVERRRYPAYDHVAVIVAEDITSRFINVLSLFAGSIPLVAIQLNAFRVGDVVSLHATKILDQRALREDDEDETQSPPVDRGYWERRSSASMLSLAETVLTLINQRSARQVQLNYNRYFVGLTDGKRSNNFINFRPRKKHLWLHARMSNHEEWVSKLEEVGLDASALRKKTGLRVRLTPNEFAEHSEVLGELISAAVDEFNA